MQLNIFCKFTQSCNTPNMSLLLVSVDVIFCCSDSVKVETNSSFFHCFYLAHSANLPEGLYILLALIFFLSFFSFLARSEKFREGLYILPMFFLYFLFIFF